MNMYPYSCTEGDGREPPRDRKDIGKHKKGTGKRSKQRKQRQDTSPDQSRSAAGVSQNSGNQQFVSENIGNATSRTLNTTSDANPLGTVASGSIEAVDAAAVAQAVTAMLAARGLHAPSSESAPLPVPPPEASPPAQSSSSGAGASTLNPSGANDSSPVPLPYPCPHCEERFKAHHRLRKHVLRTHNTRDLHYCIDCRVIASDQATILDHSWSEHTRQCPECKRRFHCSQYDLHIPYCIHRYL